jgi:hypothetical protein
MTDPERPADLQPLLDRLDAAKARLAAVSNVPYPPGETDPDAGAEETWGAAQVWAHVAEFVGYWPAQAQALADATAGEVPAVGRLKTDASRTAPIERDRNLPQAQLWARISAGIDAARQTFTAMTPRQLARTGTHPVFGTIDCVFVFRQFVVQHLEEHADQLDKLAGRARAAG